MQNIPASLYFQGSISTTASLNDRARKYLASLPPAISGQGGHRQTFAAASVLVNGFALDAGTALALLSEWNCRCSPPWLANELVHKIADAASKPSSRGRGYLLGTSRPGPVAVPPRPAPTTPDEDPAIQPKYWPRMKEGSRKALLALAELRGLGFEGIERAQDCSLLRFGEWHREFAWFLTDKGAPFKISQARPMSGQIWEWINAKSWTICCPGCAGWPIGASRIGPKPCVALVEGGPDLLAAYHFLTVEEAGADCQPCAMLGASMRIHAKALPLFTGKHVRIFPDADAAGKGAAWTWAEQLQAVGATVDWFDYSGYTTTDGQPVKDLNDLAHMSADTFEACPELRNILPRGENHGS